jgi:hypothetical protein
LSYVDNFADLVTKTTRMAFNNGGFDELGLGRGLSEIGNVQAEFWLHFEGDEDADDQIDAFRQMNDWGVQRLFMQPHDQNAAERWCLARINDISGGQNVRDMPRDRQRMKVTFQVADPFWYTDGNQNLWDSTYDWDSTITWDGTGFTTVTGSGTLPITPVGNAFTLGRVVVQVTGAQTFHQITVRRLVNSGVADEMVLQMELVDNDVIEFDPRKQWVLVNGIDQFSNFEFRHPDWLRLLPGANSIQVILDESTAVADVAVRYFERYV